MDIIDEFLAFKVVPRASKSIKVFIKHLRGFAWLLLFINVFVVVLFIVTGDAETVDKSIAPYYPNLKINSHFKPQPKVSQNDVIKPKKKSSWFSPAVKLKKTQEKVNLKYMYRKHNWQYGHLGGNTLICIDPSFCKLHSKELVLNTTRAAGHLYTIALDKPLDEESSKHLLQNFVRVGKWKHRVIHSRKLLRNETDVIAPKVKFWYGGRDPGPPALTRLRVGLEALMLRVPCDVPEESQQVLSEDLSNTIRCPSGEMFNDYDLSIFHTFDKEDNFPFTNLNNWNSSAGYPTSIHHDVVMKLMNATTGNVHISIGFHSYGKGRLEYLIDQGAWSISNETSVKFEYNSML